MNSVHKKRLIIVLLGVTVFSAAAALVIYALNENINLFYSPSQVAAGEAPVNKRIRVGGMVAVGSVQREADSLKVQFTVTNFKHSLVVHYDRVLPDLFREGQGIVATGKLNQHGHFQASEVLAKHDEKYMPPEVADMLEKEGVSRTGAYSKP
ncbi:MAG: cytochrome c maturation protein CcmE [Pseudomonadales bacterium]|nr:cytochrome c maturation protein CcmE [Pseudomonadales bacterium]